MKRYIVHWSNKFNPSRGVDCVPANSLKEAKDIVRIMYRHAGPLTFLKVESVEVMLRRASATRIKESKATSAKRISAKSLSVKAARASRVARDARASKPKVILLNRRAAIEATKVKNESK